MTDKKVEDDALEKLRAMLASGEATIFSSDEVAVLRQLIRFYRGWQALGWLGSSLRTIVIVTGTLVAAYAAVTGALAEWVKKMAGGG